ncbi:M48 family metallopeptidase [Propionivibrio limicola]|uniref:M48 family metallopeptidase n=1 Tax=Propionivibrio limicola TaxID=167645 RepID=UPI001290FCAA|nr:SprT family zinc-dependent metalloprotease [Propionivibrio limicola]
MPRLADPVFNAQPLRADETLRAIEFDGRAIQYILRRSRRRTIGLSIDQRGLRVGAPPRTPLSDIEALILRHRDWVSQKLDEWTTRRETERVAIEDGASLPVLGKTLQLQLADGRNRAIWNEFAEPPRLTLCLRAPEEAGRILETALRRKALELFAERLEHFAARMGLTAPRLSLTSARTRWGSCSQRTGIRLNWRLIHFPLHVIDYVVVHELAHLREMNHSPRFWAVVEAICPNYRQIRRELKASAGTCPRW